MIEASRHYVATAANLALVSLYWDIGRIITQDIQKNKKRAGYGKQLLQGLAEVLYRDYGKGFSRVNLQDMRRFFEYFGICQAVPDNLTSLLDPPIVDKNTGFPEKPTTEIDKSGKKIWIDFRHHAHLGWTHYRILLGIKGVRKRRFYFEQAAYERWSTREFQRKIDGALFERVAVSRDTKKLAVLEKIKKGWRF